MPLALVLVVKADIFFPVLLSPHVGEKPRKLLPHISF
jgi:hypothetical protein